MWDTKSSMAIRMEHIDDNSHGEFSFFLEVQLTLMSCSQMRWLERLGTRFHPAVWNLIFPLSWHSQMSYCWLIIYTHIYI